MLRIFANQNVNLHSPSSEGGLVNIQKGEYKDVPEDVNEHPSFEVLVENKVIDIIHRFESVLEKKQEQTPKTAAESALGAEIPEEPGSGSDRFGLSDWTAAEGEGLEYPGVKVRNTQGE
jgi:hypothetical protein